MGDVVPFIARVRSSGDWTAAERARLEELAQRLAAQGIRVETVYGATDAGDPWCVVTDENGDVLIHVARIDGRFVVHSAIDDGLSESADLHAALRDQLDSFAGGDGQDSAVVVPFGLAGRQAQTFLALVIATAFFYETVGFADAAEAAPAPAPETPAADPPPPPADIKAPTQERELAAQGAAMAEPAAARPVMLALATNTAPEVVAPVAEAQPRAVADAPSLPVQAPVAPAEAAPAAQPEPANTITGTAGDDELTGTAADERLLGGDGDDTLRGGGGDDVLQGGAGDDQLELGAGVVAEGGAGADTFVIVAPHVLGQAQTLLGVVTDFSFGEGDRLVISGGSSFVFDLPPLQQPQAPGPGTSGAGGGSQPPPPTDQPDDPGLLDGFGPSTTGSRPSESTDPAEPMRRVDIDIDGDGVMDGFVLVRVTDGPGGQLGAPISFGPTPVWDDIFA